MKVNSYKDLEVYKKAYSISLEIHKSANRLPPGERNELGSQIRRASKSIAINIAEGFARNLSTKDFKSFLVMALGSAEEVKVQLDYLYDLQYISKEEYEKYTDEYVQIGKMLVKMIKDWK